MQVLKLWLKLRSQSWKAWTLTGQAQLIDLLRLSLLSVEKKEKESILCWKALKAWNIRKFYDISSILLSCKFQFIPCYILYTDAARTSSLTSLLKLITSGVLH